MAAAGHPAGSAIVTGHHPLWTGLGVAVLLGVPAVATMALLPRVTPLSRIVSMLAATLCINGIVAEAMLVLHRWSIPGGAMVVGVISAVLWLVGWVPQSGAPGAVPLREEVPQTPPGPRLAS